MKYPKIGENVYFVHLNYIHTYCKVKKIINNIDASNEEYNAYDVEFINPNNKKVIRRAYSHELYDSEKEYKKVLFKDSIKLLTPKVEQYYKYKKQLDSFKKQLKELEKE